MANPGELPTRLGSFELVRLLAQGGMADVYLAHQAGLDRPVAVKVLNAQRSGDAESSALFVDEARVVGMLSHRNLAAVHEVAEEDGVHYLAMEYVDGADLREILLRAQEDSVALSFAAAVSIVVAAAAGLDHAHRRCAPDGRPLHLVHRDVSLSNIMVGHDGEVKVIDFGIARSTTSQHHTNPGIVRGKPAYMSPEQCLGDTVDLRTDVFALGVVLYELATGRRCFAGDSDFERMLAVVRGEWTPPSQVMPDFPPVLEQVIRTALAADPAQRYPSAAAMQDALEEAAALEGWELGTAVTAQLMSSLFGTVRLARGTASELFADATVAMRPPAPSAEDWHDEAPTRGRRSVRRMWSAVVAA